MEYSFSILSTKYGSQKKSKKPKKVAYSYKVNTYIKTTTRYHTSNRMATLKKKKKKTENTRCGQGSRATGNCILLQAYIGTVS